MEPIDEQLSHLSEVVHEYFSTYGMLDQQPVEAFIRSMLSGAKPLLEKFGPQDGLHDKLMEVNWVAPTNERSNDIMKGHSADDKNSGSGEHLMQDFNTRRMPQMASIAKLADMADDMGMHEHADMLASFMPVVRVAQYEGVQHYCIQNSRAFQKAVRDRLENKSMHDAWWDTLEEYQKSLQGEQEDFLAKYAGVTSTDEDREIGKLLVKTVTAKMTLGEDNPGVAIMETLADLEAGRTVVLAALDADDVADDIELAAGVCVRTAGFGDTMKNMWNGGVDAVKNLMSGGGQSTPSALAKRLQSSWPSFLGKVRPYIGRGDMSFTDFLSLGGKAILSPMMQFCQLAKSVSPTLPIPTLPDMNKFSSADKIPNAEFSNLITQMQQVMHLASDAATMRDLDIAAQKKPALGQAQQAQQTQTVAPQAETPQTAVTPQATVQPQAETPQAAVQPQAAAPGGDVHLTKIEQLLNNPNPAAALQAIKQYIKDNGAATAAKPDAGQQTAAPQTTTPQATVAPTGAAPVAPTATTTPAKPAPPTRGNPNARKWKPKGVGSAPAVAT